jgi:hypothetical protein
MHILAAIAEKMSHCRVEFDALILCAEILIYAGTVSVRE